MPVLENKKHESFAQAVAEGMSATQAYREHVAVAKSSTESCMSHSSRLMAEGKVAVRVAELRKDFAEVLENKLGIRRETIARLWASIIATPISEVTADHVLCQEYTEISTDQGTTRKFKMPSKADAGKELCKMAGWYPSDKITISAEGEIMESFAAALSNIRK